MFFKSSKGAPVSKQKTHGTPSILSAGLTITGDLTTEGEAQIDGILEGNISVGKLTVGEHARITGAINAHEIIIRGEVRGPICADNVHLARTAKVSGDIVWRNALSVETGAFFNGQCQHSDKPLEVTSESSVSVFEAPNRLVQNA